jgi:hypothetical protein
MPAWRTCCRASGPIPTVASLRSGESAHTNRGWWIKSGGPIRWILSTSGLNLWCAEAGERWWCATSRCFQWLSGPLCRGTMQRISGTGHYRLPKRKFAIGGECRRRATGTSMRRSRPPRRLEFRRRCPVDPLRVELRRAIPDGEPDEGTLGSNTRLSHVLSTTIRGRREIVTRMLAAAGHPEIYSAIARRRQNGRAVRGRTILEVAGW